MRFGSIPFWAAFGTLVVLASAIGIVAFQNERASAVDTDASISGTVTDATDPFDPIQGICVDVRDTDPISSLGFAITDSSGEYTIVGLPAGDYKVEFRSCGTGYFGEWYDGQPDFDSADTVPVGKSANVGGINAGLTLGGSINGTVTDENTTDPIQGIRVTVYDSSGSSIGNDTTDSGGNYAVVGLPSGDVKVEFRDDNIPAIYLSEWYDDQPDFEAAGTVPVSVKTRESGIDAALVLGGSINGTVTDVTDDAPLEDICVDVYDSDPSLPIASATTDSIGEYTVVGLPIGNLKVQFFDCASGAYLEQWYENKTDFDSATDVPVAKADEITIDAALTLASSIIICKETDPATDVLFDFDGDLGDIALLDGDCETVAPLAPGTYSVTETEATGWDLTAIDCTGTPAENIDVDLTTQTVTVTLKPDADVTCTFTNELASSIIICKETDPATDDVPFAFTGDLGTELLHGDCETFGQLEPGAYSVTEDEVTGWDLTAIGCTGTPAENIDVDLANESVTVDLKLDADVTCTFTNEHVSSIEICKDTDPESTGVSFDFDGDLGDIDLADDGCETAALEPGAYSVTENEATGWNLTAIVCTGTFAAHIDVDLADETVIVDLKLDADVTCTFTNTSKTPVAPAATSTPTATRTPTITATPTETNTATVTNTPTETNTPTNTATVTNTPTNTATVTNTPTISSANTPTDTPTKTPTNTPSGGVLGDVGCEGWVNVIDASLLLQFIAGLLPSLACEQNADVNGDGTISPVDVTLILQWLARLIDTLGPAP